jgi:Tfp pilus assembly protein PilF
MPPANATADEAPPGEDHFALALYFQRIGDFDHALTQYRALLEEHEASAEVHNNLGLLYESRGQGDEAIKQFQRAIAIDPRHVKAHNNLGVTLMRANRQDAAMAELRRAGFDPRNVESLAIPRSRSGWRDAPPRRAICSGVVHLIRAMP